MGSTREYLRVVRSRPACKSRFAGNAEPESLNPAGQRVAAAPSPPSHSERRKRSRKSMKYLLTIHASSRAQRAPKCIRNKPQLARRLRASWVSWKSKWSGGGGKDIHVLEENLQDGTRRSSPVQQRHPRLADQHTPTPTRQAHRHLKTKRTHTRTRRRKERKRVLSAFPKHTHRSHTHRGAYLCTPSATEN